MPPTGYLLSHGSHAASKADGVEQRAELMLREGRRFGPAQGAVPVRIELEYGVEPRCSLSTIVFIFLNAWHLWIFVGRTFSVDSHVS